ncbi:MAG: TetR/AcrR family transcriptional regulator [Bacillota bacterium]
MREGLPGRGDSDKRMQLLEAAVDVFALEGFHRAKVEDIAAAAGVGKGTVYHYFSSKQELFQAMLEMSFNKYRSRMRAQLRDPVGLHQRLESMLAAHLEFVWQHRKMAQLLLTDNRPLPEKMYRWMWQQRRRMMVYVIRMLKQGMLTGEIRPVDPRVASLVVLGLFTSLGSQLAFGPEKFNRDKLAADAVQVLMAGLAGK